MRAALIQKMSAWQAADPKHKSIEEAMIDDVVLRQLKASLFAGHYNLLLGSGASLDSTDSSGQPLLGATALTEILCKLKGAKPSTSLSRVALLLNPQEVDEQLTTRYRNCRPGDTPTTATKFLWKQIYTFNIDDCLEEAYRKNLRRKQSAVPINYLIRNKAKHGE